jgi:subtilisin-like proprotein convertase family protein
LEGQSTSPTLNLSIPDGDFAGTSNTQTLPVGQPDSRIIDVTVVLNVVGDYVGDIYALLLHNDGGLAQHAVLLNRVGRTSDNPLGYDDGALNVRLNDAAPQGDIHSYRLTLSGDPTVPVSGGLTGLWAPDGRDANPTTVLDTTPRTAPLASFNGVSPNGTWTLFLADVDPGGQNTLVSWGLEITTAAVPEPEAWAIIFGGMCLAVAVLRRRSRRTHLPGICEYTVL